MNDVHFSNKIEFISHILEIPFRIRIRNQI